MQFTKNHLQWDYIIDFPLNIILLNQHQEKKTHCRDRTSGVKVFLRNKILNGVFFCEKILRQLPPSEVPSEKQWLLFLPARHRQLLIYGNSNCMVSLFVCQRLLRSVYCVL